MTAHVLTLKGPMFSVFEDRSRFRAVCAGRRSGKTMLDVMECLAVAGEKRKANVEYIAPTWEMAKDLAWEPLKELTPSAWLAGRPNESELSVRLKNGSRIRLRSAEKPDRLRGAGRDFVVLDEYAEMDPAVWPTILPSLADKSRNGRALLTFTPKGFNHAYELWLKGQPGTKDPEWSSWQFCTIDCGWVEADRVALDRAQMDPRMFRQEYEASFEALGNRVYDYFERAVHVSADIRDNGAEILVGMDFNINPMSAVIAQKAGDECQVLDALELQVSNTDEMAAELRSRYPNRRIIVCPDPSGNSRKTSAPVGQTDFTILKRFGFVIDADPSAPIVPDRVNNVQSNLKTADGQSHVRVHPKAAPLIKALEGLTYKEGTNQPDKGPLSHVSDAFGYLLWQRFNRLRNRQASSFTLRI